MTKGRIQLDHLRPTQMTVGFREVGVRRAMLEALRETHPRRFDDYLHRHRLPMVLGPGGQHFLIDHHHLARALWEMGLTHAPAERLADLSDGADAGFWGAMARRGWEHPVDADGRPHDPVDLPHHLRDLKDDPYRSLAWAVRDAGGFEKVRTPYAEFAWADFFRPFISDATIRNRFPAAMKMALSLAHSEQAEHLPGATVSTAA